MHNNHSHRLSSSNLSNNFIEKSYSHGIGISPVDTTITGNTAVGCGTLNTSSYRDIYVSLGSLGYVKRCTIVGNAAYVYTDGNTYEATVIANNL